MVYTAAVAAFSAGMKTIPCLTFPTLPSPIADSFEKAVLANTNVGGENCHRGAALGALMGAALGESKIPRRLIDGLHDTANIRKEIDAYTAAMFPEANLANGSCL